MPKKRGESEATRLAIEQEIEKRIEKPLVPLKELRVDPIACHESEGTPLRRPRLKPDSDLSCGDDVADGLIRPERSVPIDPPMKTGVNALGNLQE